MRECQQQSFTVIASTYDNCTPMNTALREALKREFGWNFRNSNGLSHPSKINDGGQSIHVQYLDNTVRILKIHQLISIILK